MRDLARNDIEGALAIYVHARLHGTLTSGLGHFLLMMQDDSTEFERRVDEISPELPPLPPER